MSKSKTNKQLASTLSASSKEKKHKYLLITIHIYAEIVGSAGESYS